MAELFLLYVVIIAFIVSSKRNIAMPLIAITILLSLLMLAHHATDVLKINW